MERNKTVLVVDDQEAIVQLAKTVLYMEGYTVIFGCSGEDALFVNANHPFPIDLLLTDIRMGPDLNGCDLAQAMRLLRPEIRVIYMSAYADDDRVHEEAEAGTATFLPKPFSPSQLVGVVAKVLSGASAPFR
jgi:two-component system, cell cycle sensor histidine kinase and response regulator CckA